MMRSILLAATLLATPCLFQGAARAQPVTGLYIGGAGGANFLQQEHIKSFRTPQVSGPSRARIDLNTGAVGIGSLGYGFGNGVRIELEGNYRNNEFNSNRVFVFGRPLNGREQKYGAMGNVLFDLDIGSRYVFPYIGAGAGYEWVTQRQAATRVFGNSLGGTDSSFAYQAIAGVSLPIPPVVGLSLTAEYRYYALTGQREFTVTNAGFSQGSNLRYRTAQDYNHSLLIGLRYAFNVVPPAPPATPTPVATPVQQDARTYLVFFDWDRADLTDRARQIVAEAAKAASRVQVTRIEVAGHADLTGSDSYNMRLSLRRAQAVAAELVRLGVPRESITTQGFGKRNPLVQTAEGVREPQNRRVEIVFR
ncbi:MAG: OmpA family protein [Acetobacteraceae bacterium]